MINTIKYRKIFKALEFLCVMTCIVGISGKNVNLALYPFVAFWLIMCIDNLYRINFYPDVKINRGGDMSFIAMQPYILCYVIYGIRNVIKLDNPNIIYFFMGSCLVILALSFIVIYNRYIKGNYVNIKNYVPKAAEIPEYRKNIYRFSFSVAVLVFGLYLKISGKFLFGSRQLMVFSYAIFLCSLTFYHGLLSKEERQKAKAQKAEIFLTGLALYCLFIVNIVFFF